MSYLQSAFESVCKEAKTPEIWYVSLMEATPRYGGPEEGGWWTNDHHLVAYQEFASEGLARAAEVKVKELARELSEEARKGFGEQCRMELEWLEQRGLEADFLAEPDGESEFYVVVSQGLPEESSGPTHYE